MQTSDALHPAAPFMLGFGFMVLGGVTLAATTALIVDGDLGDITADGIGALTLTYLFGACFAGVGAYLAIGALAGEVAIQTRAPGWAWFAAVTSLVGGLSTLAAIATYFVDDDLGADSIAFGIGALASYVLTLTVLIGLEDSGGTRVAVVPLDGGAAFSMQGSF